MIYYYGVWFLTLFLIPTLVVFRRSSISKEMRSLDGLVLKPELKDGTVVAMANDFAAFVAEKPQLKRDNIVVKILQTMCDDAAKGVCHSASLYLSTFRAALRKIILWVLLGSHIPLIVLLFRERGPFAALIKYQVCAYVLVYMLEMALQYKYAAFTKIFYTSWYDKIVNFDLLTVRMIHHDVERIKGLSNSGDLLEAIDKFMLVNNTLSNELSSTANMLSSRLDEFLSIQDAAKGINAQTVLSSFDDCTKKALQVTTHMEGIAKNVEASLTHLTALSESKRLEINAVNRNTEVLYELRQRFKTYQSEAFSAELSHLQHVAESLENNVSKAFAGINTAITQHYSHLEMGYDSFFDMCKSLSEAMSDKYEEKTAAILAELLTHCIAAFTAISERMNTLTASITGTSDATKVLCETMFDFTRYTADPNFMRRIAKYVNFSRKLKSAADTLLSYQKLIELAPRPTEKKPAKEQQASEESRLELNTIQEGLVTVQNQLKQLNDKVMLQIPYTSLSFKTEIKNDIQNTKQAIEKLESKLTQQKTGLEILQRQLGELQQPLKTPVYLAPLNQQINQQKKEVEDIKKQLGELQQSLKTPADLPPLNQQNTTLSSGVQAVDAFNQWAKDTQQPLPPYFTYVYVNNAKLELRKKQEFTDTTVETAWIRNTSGDKKYFFPNPNWIGNHSGILDDIYRVTGTRKAKGANCVKITKACQIDKDNVIEYKGELTLL
ncbi:hypothetical protein ACYULU_04205 [Breznakiellaceae bacterium SP9]